jgi:hypothetical protein
MRALISGQVTFPQAGPRGVVVSSDVDWGSLQRPVLNSEDERPRVSMDTIDTRDPIIEKLREQQRAIRFTAGRRAALGR